MAKTESKSKALSKERLLLLLAILGTSYVLMLYSNIFGRLQEQWFPKSELYGIWVEQNVAPYAAQKNHHWHSRYCAEWAFSHHPF